MVTVGQTMRVPTRLRAMLDRSCCKQCSNPHPGKAFVSPIGRVRMAEREVLIAEIDAFLCEREQDEKQLDRWECHHIVKAIAYIATPIDAHLGVALFHKCRVPEGGRLDAEIDAIPKADMLLTLAEARASFEEAKNRPLREL